MTRRTPLILAASLCMLLAATSSQAQLEDNLSVFTEENASLYLEPLRDVAATGLSDGLFISAHIPKASPYFRISLQALIIDFGDAARTFTPVNEDYFPGDLSDVDVPTIIGDEDGVQIQDPGSGTTFSAPGGFDISRTALATPQITVGGFFGTEVMGRWLSLTIGDDDYGDMSLWGLGARHSISQYFGTLPIDLSGMIFYQKFNLGDDLVDFDQMSYGIQASKRFPFVEPYAGLALDRSSMTAKYEFNAGTSSPETLKVDFDSESNVHFTLGAALRLFLVHLNAEINFAEHTSYALGLSIGN